LRKPQCSIEDDDMVQLADKLQSADAIVSGSPVYFRNVTGRLKVFMNRTRWLHMKKNLLEGKLGAAIAHAALRKCGQEMTQLLIEGFLLSHGLHIVEACEPNRPI
jgi:multimeric flavodoxin WrbA